MYSSSQHISDSPDRVEYPRQVFYIYASITLERFGFFGILPVLSTFLTEQLNVSEKNAKVIYHSFLLINHLLPIYGAVLADWKIGKYATTVYTQIVYALGTALLMCVCIPQFHLPAVPFTIFALILIAIGRGGMKMPVVALGGDQFLLPTQHVEILTYFAVVYFLSNTAAVANILLSPWIRSRPCFGRMNCYSMSFGLSFISIVASLICFMVGRMHYHILIPRGNLIVDITKCITNALKVKANADSDEKLPHWLDYSNEKYGPMFVYDLKSVLRIMLLFLPIPMFWALYDQKGSTWVFMARHMNGDINFYTILPEHTQIINPILLLLLIPFFEYFIYPIFMRMQILKSPLQRMLVGAMLAVVATIIAALICFKIEENPEIIAGKGQAQFLLYNNNPCDVTMHFQSGKNVTTFHVQQMNFQSYMFAVSGEKEVNLTMDGVCMERYNETLHTKEMYNYGVHITKTQFTVFIDNVQRESNSRPKVKFLVAGQSENDNNAIAVLMDGTRILSFKTQSSRTMLLLPKAAKYTIKYRNEETKVKMMTGGVYAVLINLQEKNNMVVKNLELTKHNMVHMLWMLPQYIVLSVAEILLSITGSQFSYAESPKSMNTLLYALWNVTYAFGNLIVIIVEEMNITKLLSYKFLIYGGLMLLDVGLQAYLSFRYIYYKGHGHNDDDIYNYS